MKRERATEVRGNSKLEIKFIPKQIYGMGDARYEPRQHISDIYQVGHPTLLKRYLEGDIGICLKIRCGFGEINSPELYAVFSDLNGVWGAEPNNIWQIAMDVENPRFPNSDLLTDCCSCSHENKELVFIRIVELADGRKDGIIGSSRSATRLYSSQDFTGFGANILYCSLLTGVSEFFLRGINGELVPFLNRIGGSQNESCEQMVETGSQIVDDFTRKDSKPVRNITFEPSYKDIISRVVLRLTNDSVRFLVRPDKGTNLVIEIVDAFVGPLNFRSTPTKKINHESIPQSINPSR